MADKTSRSSVEISYILLSEPIQLILIRERLLYHLEQPPLGYALDLPK